MCGIACASCTGLQAGTAVFHMLDVLTNRGRQATGVAMSGGCQPHDLVLSKAAGPPHDVFPRHTQPLLRGHSCIGHVRYATNRGSGAEGAHPFRFGDIAVCHNGNVINTDQLRAELSPGTELKAGSDTEIMAALLGQTSGSLHDRLTAVLPMLKGSYVITVIQSGGTIAIARDPLGFRPVTLGSIDFPGSHSGVLAASETSAIEMIGGIVEDEIAPGEILYIYPDQTVERVRFAPTTQHKHCIFELIYFARPMTKFWGVSCLNFRKALGQKLVVETCTRQEDETLIVPVLNSGLGGSLGIADAMSQGISPILTNTGLADRTFIEAEQWMRELGVAFKHFPCDTPPGIRYLVVDDSIVRGTTIGPILNLLRRNDPRSMEVMIPCPPFLHHCPYGIDVPRDEDLIAHNLNGDVDAIGQHIGADSLHYLSLDGLKQVITSFGWSADDFCYACFDGDYPVT